MYMAGRLRTASSPSRTWMLEAPYSPFERDVGRAFGGSVSAIGSVGGEGGIGPKRERRRCRRESREFTTIGAIFRVVYERAPTRPGCLRRAPSHSFPRTDQTYGRGRAAGPAAPAQGAKDGSGVKGATRTSVGLAPRRPTYQRDVPAVIAAATAVSTAEGS